MNKSSHFFEPPVSEFLHQNGPITLGSRRIFTGCNTYHATSVIRQRVQFGSLAGETSATISPEFPELYLDRFRGLKTFIPQNGLPDDFVGRLTSYEGTGFDEILLQAILAVEAAVAFSQHELDNISYAVVEKHRDYTSLIWASEWPRLSRHAAMVAMVGVSEILPEQLYPHPRDASQSYASMLEALLMRARRRRLSPATAVIKFAARKRGLPCESTGRQHLRLGQGSLQQAVYSSTTSSTSIVAQKICSDKYMTHRRLEELRLPVPRQLRVDSVEAARFAASKLGFPVVVKPAKSRKGQGVTAGLNDLEGVERAFTLANEAKSGVLVEAFVQGSDHRLLVINGKFVAALSRRPPTITGNGESTIKELIDALNADPCRDGFRLFQVDIDTEVKRCLSEAGLGLEDVLSEGRQIALRSVANVSLGGLPIDVTDQVHPDNREMAERATKGVGLNVAGVDFLTTDISRSFREVGGGIVELNSRPGLDMHMWPHLGIGRNVAGEILNLSFPTGSDGRIPTVGIAGDSGTGTAARILDRLLRGAGRTVALALRKRSYVNGVAAGLKDEQQTDAARILLRDPDVDTVVSTISPREVARRGLMLETLRLSVILEKVKDGDTPLFHSGLDVVQRATTDCVVVGAGNTVARDRLLALGARKLILVSEHPNDPAVQEHLNGGHAAVVTTWQKGEVRIVLLSGTEALASFPVGMSSSDSGTVTNHRRRGMMFALAAAFGIGLSAEEIKAAIRSAPPMVMDTGR